MSSKKDKREFTVEYQGTWVSVNSLRNNNYKVNQGLKRKFRSIYAKLIKEKMPKEGMPFDRFSIHLRYNSRLDTDNPTTKFFVDALKDCGVIIDDNKKYFRQLNIQPDETLKFNTYVIDIKEV